MQSTPNDERVAMTAPDIENDNREEYDIVIRSFDRPEQLCRTTLALLRSHGASLSDVGVFITASARER